MGAPNPLRVVFVNRMAGMVRGGGETFDLEIARHLAEQGVEIQFVTGQPLFGKAQTPIRPHPTHYLRTPYSGDLNVYGMKMGWRIRDLDIRLFERAALKWLLRHQQDYDLVQVCELTRLVNRWVGHQRVPMVLRMPGPQIYGPSSALNRADALVASGASMEGFRRDVRADVADIPNGVDTERFKPQPSSFRRDHGIPEDALVLVFVARFVPVKNHAMLVRAFHRLQQSMPHAHLVLAGSGPEESAIRQLIQDRGCPNVLMLGELSFDKVPAVYAASDLKVISSDYESFSFVALEAMASGLPLVVTETDWIPRLICQDQGGVVVPTGNEDALFHALQDLARDSARRQTLGQWNREHILQNYTWQDSAKKLLNLYSSLVDARGKR